MKIRTLVFPQIAKYCHKEISLPCRIALRPRQYPETPTLQFYLEGTGFCVAIEPIAALAAAGKAIVTLFQDERYRGIREFGTSAGFPGQAD